jgi:hypothetical protein
VPNSLDGALALLGPDDDLRRDVERSSLQAAKQRTPHPRSRLRPVPGSGELRRLGRLSAMHALPRFPRLQACVSAGRLVTCAKASAGQRDGPSGTKIGHASLPGAFADAAVRGLRANPAGHKDLGRLEKTHGTGTALTVLAYQRARAVSALLKGDTAVERPTFLTGERPRRGRAWRLTGP